MKYKAGYKMFVFWGLLFFVLLTGCKEDKDILAENGNEFITDSDYLTNETTGDSQAIVMQEDKSENHKDESLEKTNKLTSEKKTGIEYGDRINISYDKYTGWYEWKYINTVKFEVSSNSNEFRDGKDISDSDVMLNVNQVIGKNVGDIFVLWFEEDDGLRGYEYTITDVTGTNNEFAEKEDELYTSYVMYEIDANDNKRMYTGEQIIKLSETEEFFANVTENTEYSIGAITSKMQNILGKKIGESFETDTRIDESCRHYTYTIQGIKKAIQYGDEIEAEVREVFIPKEHTLIVTDKESIFDLVAKNGFFEIDGERPGQNEYDISLSRTVFQSLKGKKKDDTVRIELKNNNDWGVNVTVYQIDILSVSSRTFSGKVLHSDMQPLMEAEDNDIIYINNSEETNGSHRRDDIIFMIVVQDDIQHMVYEYKKGGNNPVGIILDQQYKIN